MSFANDGQRSPDPGVSLPLSDMTGQEPVEIALSAEDEAELDAIMDQLRSIGDTVDPPPPIAYELARAAFETRNLDDELAILTADSDVDELELVRSVQVEPRMVSFETATVSVELQLDHDDDLITVRGLVIGAVGQVLLETGHQRITAKLDERGWFVVTNLRGGALRLRLLGVDGGNVTTEWITT